MNQQNKERESSNITSDEDFKKDKIKINKNNVNIELDYLDKSKNNENNHDKRNIIDEVDLNDGILDTQIHHDLDDNSKDCYFATKNKIEISKTNINLEHLYENKQVKFSIDDNQKNNIKGSLISGISKNINDNNTVKNNSQSSKKIKKKGKMFNKFQSKSKSIEKEKNLIKKKYDSNEPLNENIIDFDENKLNKKPSLDIEDRNDIYEKNISAFNTNIFNKYYYSENDKNLKSSKDEKKKNLIIICCPNGGPFEYSISVSFSLSLFLFKRI